MKDFKLETKSEILKRNDTLLKFISVLISSDPFARLSKTTQVANMTESNPHLKNRLSHSLDVAEIAGLILSKLDLKIPLEEYLRTSNVLRAISYAHDIGHTGGGHLVERMLRKVIPFEGNNNNQIVLEKEFNKLEVEIPNEVLVGLIKYPYKYNESIPFKGLYNEQYEKYIPILIDEYIQQRITFLSYANPEYKDSNELKDIYIDYNKLNKCFEKGETMPIDIRLFETKLMEIADDITYLTHDLKDFVTHFTPKGFKLNFFKCFDKYETVGDENFKNVIKLLDNLTSENAKTSTLHIRDYLINNVKIDENSDMDFKEPFINDLMLTIREINMKYYIKPIDSEYVKVLDIDKFINIYMGNVNNKTFLNEFIVSDTYKNKIIESPLQEDKMKYMGYYLAEMTDEWMIHRMRLFNCVNQDETSLQFDNVKRAVYTNLFEEISSTIVNKDISKEINIDINHLK